MKKIKSIFSFAILAVMLASCEPEPVKPNITEGGTLQGTLTQNTTLKRGSQWTLKGYVYVPEGINLTIEPGVTVKSDIAEKGALCIERGAKIYAEGTESSPIIFTSGRPESERAPGDWGGIVILGKATTNKVDPTIEGGIGRTYGGNDDNDNSGILRYVRVEYAGIAAFPNSEINGFTFAGVGRGTIVDYCESYYANDDAFEFFGGTVNCSHLIAVGTADDDYDFDFGYTGTIQYAISKRDPAFVDGVDAGNGIECDNDGTGSSATPITKPTLINFTLIGPNDPTAKPNHNLAMRWRRNTNFRVFNSIFYGYMKGGFSIESDGTAQSFIDGTSTVSSSWISSYDTTNLVKTTSTLLSKSVMVAKTISSGTILYTGNSKPFDANFQTLASGSLVDPTWGAIPAGLSNWTLNWSRF